MPMVPLSASAATTETVSQQRTINPDFVADEVNKLPWITAARPAPDAKYYIFFSFRVWEKLSLSGRERKIAKKLVRECKKMQKKGIAIIILVQPHMAYSQSVEDVQQPVIEEIRRFLKKIN